MFPMRSSQQLSSEKRFLQKKNQKLLRFQTFYKPVQVWYGMIYLFHLNTKVSQAIATTL